MKMSALTGIKTSDPGYGWSDSSRGGRRIRHRRLWRQGLRGESSRTRRCLAQAQCQQQALNLGDILAALRGDKWRPDAIVLQCHAQVGQGLTQALGALIELLKSDEAVGHQVQAAGQRQQVPANEASASAQVAVSKVSLHLLQVRDTFLERGIALRDHARLLLHAAVGDLKAIECASLPPRQAFVVAHLMFDSQARLLLSGYSKRARIRMICGLTGSSFMPYNNVVMRHINTNIGDSMSETNDITPAEYQALAEFRYELRRFLHFSEQASRAAGLEPQQHQLLLAIKGLPTNQDASVGELAERLQIQHHSTVELVNCMVERGLLERRRDEIDQRRVLVRLTPYGEEVLKKLSLLHRMELRAAGPALVQVLISLTNDTESADDTSRRPYSME